MGGIEELGKKAYQKQMWGAYEEAVAVYTDAIKRYPNDSRLLNNRCMCYLEMKDYKRALDDAERMILLFSKNKKSYFRKGEVLMNLKRYSEAANAFKMVQQLDPSCEDAIKLCFEAQSLELSKRGKYPKAKVIRALRMTNSVEGAEHLLKSGKLDAMLAELENAIYYSDDEIEVTSNKYDPLLDPMNPLGCTSLWVGNLTKETPEHTLRNLFGKHGQIKSMKVLTQYAFINYYDAAGPANAMRSLQGTNLNGKILVIKYPDNASKKNGRFR